MEPSPPSADDVLDCLERGEETAAVDALDRAVGAAADDKATLLRALQDAADTTALGPLCPALEPFLTDEERSVRLNAAKLFVAVARVTPDAALPAVDALADRLRDDTELYFVRARAAEALGHVALEHPEAAATPEILADLRIDLDADEPELREKLAEALELVALGDPTRLRHHVGALTDHLDDEAVLVRYHLTTALVVLATAAPDRLDAAEGPLRDRLSDEDPHVRGRAAEALGVLARAEEIRAAPER